MSRYNSPVPSNFQLQCGDIVRVNLDVECKIVSVAGVMNDCWCVFGLECDGEPVQYEQINKIELIERGRIK